MVHGFQQWQDRCWQVVTWAPSMSTTGDVWCTDTFCCWCCQRASHSLASAQNCQGSTGLQSSLCTLGTEESYKWWQSSLYRTVRTFLATIGHVILITESSFGAEAWLITQNLKPTKGRVIEQLSSPSSKENGSIVISKADHGKLSWYQTRVLVLDFLDHGDTVDCCCGTLSLWRPFFAKGIGYFFKASSFCTKMPGVMHPTGQLFMAVHLIG